MKNKAERDENGQVVRGPLLFIEDPKVHKRRTGKARRMVPIAAIVGAMGIIFAIFNIISPSICGISASIILVVLSIILIMLGFLIMLGKGVKIPLEFFEGGAVDHSMVGGGEIFIPYGNFTSFQKINEKGLGKIYVLNSLSKEKVWIWTDQPNAKEHLDRILKRVASSDWAGVIENETRERMMMNGMPIITTVLTIIGSVACGLIMMFMGDYSWKIGLLSVPSVLILMTFIFHFRNRSRKNIAPGSPKVKVRPLVKESGLSFKLDMFTISLGIILGVIFSVIAISAPGGLMPDTIHDQIAPDDHLPLTLFNVSGQHNISDDIRVKNGEELILTDSVLYFNGTSVDPNVVHIDDGGTVTADNVTFSSLSGEGAISWEIHGKGTFTNCTFDGIWGDMDDRNGEGGIEVYGKDVTFSSCIFKNGISNLMMVVDTMVVIEDCHFSNTEDDAIELQNSEMEITGSTIEDVEWGIMAFDGSSVTVHGCTFNDLYVGIAVSWSDCTVVETVFNNVSSMALSEGFRSEFTLEEVEYSNVVKEKGTSGGIEMIFFGICSIAPISIGVIVMISLIIVRRKQKNKEEKG